MIVNRVVKIDKERSNNDKRFIRDIDGNIAISCPLSKNSYRHVDCAFRQITKLEQSTPEERDALFCGEKLIGVIEDSSIK